MNVLKRVRGALLSAAISAALILLLVFPARYTESVREGISLWAVSVLPATLPFLILTALFTKLPLYKKIAKRLSPFAQTLFGVSGDGGCAALLSAISGYPVGAKTVQMLAERGRIGRDEVLRVAALATTSGPAFLIGAVGCGMLKSPLLGQILYISHLAGVYLVCLAMRPHKKRGSAPAAFAAERPDLGEAISSSVLSVLCVGAAIALFNAFGEMVADFGALLSLPPAVVALLRGLMEMTAGCAQFCQTPSSLSLGLCAFFTTFGGMCVLVQQAAFLKRAGVKMLPFLGVKLAQGLLAAAICMGLSALVL